MMVSKWNLGRRCWGWCLYGDPKKFPIFAIARVPAGIGLHVMGRDFRIWRDKAND